MSAVRGPKYSMVEPLLKVVVPKVVNVLPDNFSVAPEAIVMPPVYKHPESVVVVPAEIAVAPVTSMPSSQTSLEPLTVTVLEILKPVPVVPVLRSLAGAVILI